MAEPVYSTRPWAVGAGVAGTAMFTLYITLILSEGDNSLTGVLPWATLMAIAAVLAIGGAVVEDLPMARRLLVSSAVLFAGLGLLSLLSIGVGFVLAAFLAGRAAGKLTNPEPD